MNPEFNFGQSIIPLIGKTAGMMGHVMTEKFRQAGYDISIEHWIVLVHLWQKDGRNQQELAGKAGKHKTAITRAINWLEGRDFVVRVPDKTDRRNNLIYLTHKGKNLKDVLVPCATETLDEATLGISFEDIEHCKRVLRMIQENMSKYLW
ncbi:MAG: MarR family transcriptional regulator [Bacteroidia bacterium]|nr:MarR family transcriptional regulator [Bacteroidia bacterium]